MKPADDSKRQRALRYVGRPELVWAKMAPPFAVTTTDALVNMTSPAQH